MMQSCCIAYWLVGELRQHFAGCTVFTVRDHKNLQENYKMECNIKEIGGQRVECSNGKIVITAAVKGDKEWQDRLQDFQLKIRSPHAAELHSGRFMFVNIQTTIKLSTVANGARIQSVGRN